MNPKIFQMACPRSEKLPRYLQPSRRARALRTRSAWGPLWISLRINLVDKPVDPRIAKMQAAKAAKKAARDAEEEKPKAAPPKKAEPERR